MLVFIQRSFITKSSQKGDILQIEEGDMRTLARKGFTLVILMALVVMGAGTAAAADKMPVGPVKLIVAPCHGFARMVNTSFKTLTTGLKRYGPFGVPIAAVATTLDTVENVARTAGNMATPWNDVNYNLNVGEMNQPAQAVMDLVPPLLPF